MLAFISGLPVWVLILAAIAVGYVAFNWWKKRKAAVNAPKSTLLNNSDVNSLRDNIVGTAK
jgi:type III secretory pathway component EscV